MGKVMPIITFKKLITGNKEIIDCSNQPGFSTFPLHWVEVVAQ